LHEAGAHRSKSLGACSRWSIRWHPLPGEKQDGAKVEYVGVHLSAVRLNSPCPQGFHLVKPC